MTPSQQPPPKLSELTADDAPPGSPSGASAAGGALGALTAGPGVIGGRPGCPVPAVALVVGWAGMSILGRSDDGAAPGSPNALGRGTGQ
jgi:hypothetical protein